MRKLPAVILSLLLAVSAHAATSSYKTYRGTVERVVDGDTIRFMPENAAPGTKSWSIRMVSTDTPETHLPSPGGMVSQGYWGDAAADELASILHAGESVEVDSYGIDHYGRVLGRIFKRGVDINLEMVKSGWGSLYVICDENSCDMDANYRRACDNAMDRGLGIFNPQRRIPMLPFVFRSIHQQRPFQKLVGNIRTRKFVAPDQYGKVPLCDRVFFMTEDDARAEGFSPATAN